MVISQIFRYHLVFRIVIAAFGFSSAFYNMMFFFVLLQHFICVGDDSDKYNGFNQTKISNYGHQYVEELESWLF